MVGSSRFRWLFGRGIIATLASFPLLFSTGCRVSDSNQLKDAKQAQNLSRYQSEFRDLKRRQFALEAEIASAEKDIAARTRERDRAVARLMPVTLELADKLRLVKRMEEDLVAAKKKEAAIRARVAAAAELDRKTAQLAKLDAGIEAAETAIAQRRKVLEARTAALAALRRSLAEIDALEAKLREQLGPPPAKRPPGKKPPGKKPSGKKPPGKKRPGK